MKLPILLLVILISSDESLSAVLDTTIQVLLNQVNKIDVSLLNITKRCKWQIELLREHPSIIWQMLDASAKFPYAGMTDTGRIELGSFDQCLSIHHTFDDVRILGKYCYAGLVLPDLTNISNYDLYFKLATCTPDACSASDLLTIADSIIPDFPPLFIDEACTTKETGRELSFGTLVFTSILISIIFLMVLSTGYEIYCYNMEYKLRNPIVLAFSVVANCKNIFKTTSQPSKETIQIFSGFRIISIVWIIAGHGVLSLSRSFIPVINMDYVVSRMNMRSSTYLMAANYAVATFFFMSGFLVSFLYFKRKIQSWQVQLKCLPTFYLHRYVRLIVPMIILYFGVIYIFQHFGSGPLWYAGSQIEINNCKKYWWSYFLFIQNYVNWEEMCLIPLWYVSADMQLYILAPFVLIPVSIILKSRNGFTTGMITLMGLNVLFLMLHIGIRFAFPSYTKNTYNTHERLTDYFMGIMMGVFMRFKKDQPFLMNMKSKLAYRINLLLWLIVLTAMFTVFLFFQDEEVRLSDTERIFYWVFSKLIWTVGLCWMVYSCYHGRGGVINWILCSQVCQVGAKLTYSMFLLHYLVLAHYALSNRMKFYISDYTEFYLFCGYFVETLIISFLWTLAFESPFIAIEKYLFGSVKRIEFNENHSSKQQETPA